MQHKVLLVDDDPHIAAGLRRTLRREPFEILSACSGLDALDIMAHAAVDVVVADQDMPGMKGNELLARIAQTHPDTVRFMLTGKPSLDVAIAAINGGAISRFFTKPANDVDLAATIRQALQQKDLMAEAMRLLMRFKQQNALIDRLERQNPGITHVDKDGHGSIMLEDCASGDYEALIMQLRSAL